MRSRSAIRQSRSIAPCSREHPRVCCCSREARQASPCFRSACAKPMGSGGSLRGPVCGTAFRQSAGNCGGLLLQCCAQILRQRCGSCCCNALPSGGLISRFVQIVLFVQSPFWRRSRLCTKNRQDATPLLDRSGVRVPAISCAKPKLTSFPPCSPPTPQLSPAPPDSPSLSSPGCTRNPGPLPSSSIPGPRCATEPVHRP